MKIVKIAEALTRIGEQISGVHGTLTAVYQRRTGEGQYGPYSFQDGLLKDDTGSIIITFANFDDMSARKGEKMTVTAKQGDKGLSGILVKESEYQGKKKINLHVTGSAFIDSGTTPVENDDPQDDLPMGDDEEAQAMAALKKAREAKAARLKQEAESSAKQASNDKAPPLNGMDYTSVKRRIIQTANLYHYALRSSRWALEKHDMEIKDVTASAATLFLAFRHDGLTDAMPTTLMGDEATASKPSEATQVEPPEETYDQEPKTWRDVVLHLKDDQHFGDKLADIPTENVEVLFSTFKPKVNPKTGNYEMKDLYLVNALKEWRKETK